MFQADEPWNDLLRFFSHLNVGVLLRYWVGEKCHKQKGVIDVRMKL